VRSRGPCDPAWTTAIDLCPWRCCFEPDRIGIGCDHVVYLVDRRRRLLWSFTGHGIRAAKREVPADTETIAAGPTVALGGAYGIVRRGEALATAKGANSAADEAVLLTPTLISPREQGATWQRARIRAELPLGTALSVRVAASEDDGLARRVAEIAARPGLSPTQRLLALDGLLPWDPTLETTLTAADDPLKRGWFDAVLDGVKGPYLWLALHLHVPPTSRPARLRRLEVRYPARSWIEDLPAIYRAEPARAAELRRFLAVFETVFDDLEERIEKLPERLAAPGAELEWADFLLRWLGLPLPADLPADRKREFLAQAPALLLRRGTPWALQKALHIVTGREVHIDDLGDHPLPWVLGRGGTRLGDDSLLIHAGQPGFVLGGTARLKRDALGQRDPEATELVARRTQGLTIEIEGRPEDEADLRAGIEATLDHFLPAACRSELRLTQLNASGQGRHLDRDLRTMDPRIGRTMRLGRSALPATRHPARRTSDPRWSASAALAT
jgi:phage tail-like protein